MAEETKQNKKQSEENKKMEAQKPTEVKQEKADDKKTEEKIEAKDETKKEEKKIEVKKIKKDYALINGMNLPLSTKDGAHICDMIRYKNIDVAIKMVENVIVKKQVVEMRNREVGHKHGKGIMGGRYPVDASKEFLRLLKNLRATAIFNELDLEKVVLMHCMTNKAARPYKRGGSRMKRSHITLKLAVNPKQKNKQTKPAKEGKKANK
jgi:ribosomal protein L22